jgi:hypothetical protein
MRRMDYTKQRRSRRPDRGEYRTARDYLNRNGDDTATCKSCRSVNKLIAAHGRADGLELGILRVPGCAGDLFAWIAQSAEPSQRTGRPAKPQVSGPGRFSAPTRPDGPESV